MPRTGRPPIELDKQQIIKLYEDGLSSFRIASLFNVSWATIIRRLKYWNVPIRYQYSAWNKGLSTLTDERVYGNSLKTSRMLGHKHTDEAKLKMSLSQKGKNIWSKGSKKSEETRRRNSEATKRMWQNPEYQSKVRQEMIRANHIRPTRPEQRIIDIIQKYNLPFKYTGDGSLIIHGVNPDFVNCNGAKVVMEVFGDYWHNDKRNQITWKRTELGRIMLFNSFGFQCVILWESQINSLSDEEIVERINNETRRLSHLHGQRAKRQNRII